MFGATLNFQQQVSPPPFFQPNTPAQQQQGTTPFYWRPGCATQQIGNKIDGIRDTLIKVNEHYDNSGKSWGQRLNPWHGCCKYSFNIFSVDNSINIGNRVNYNGNERNESKFLLGLVLSTFAVIGSIFLGVELGHLENCNKGIRLADSMLNRSDLSTTEHTIAEAAKDAFKAMRSSSRQSLIFKGLVVGGLALAAVGAFFAHLNAVVVALPVGLSLALAGAIGLAVRAGVNYAKGHNADMRSEIQSLLQQINAIKPRIG